MSRDAGGGTDAAMLSLVDVRKRYVTGPVVSEILRGVRLEVNRGDLLSIVGPSGCGKSTLMNIIGLLDRPTRAPVRFQDQGPATSARSPTDELAAASQQACIGFVFQSFHLLERV